MEHQAADERPAISSEGYSVDELSGEQNEMQAQLCVDILRDIAEDRVVLPSLPDQALAIRRMVEDDQADVDLMAKAMIGDAALAAKVIKSANSPLYAGESPVASCGQAIVRMGTNTTAQLILTFALGELFVAANGQLKQRITELWHHSTEVAAISFVLARITGRFEPETAMLAGLLHDIGSICVLGYADRGANEEFDLEAVDRTVVQLRGQLGGMVLRSWNFPDEIVSAAESAEDWTREGSEDPDYADLINVAHLHILAILRDLPVDSLDAIPAIGKLLDGGLNPNLGFEVLTAAREQIESARGLLRA